MTKTLKKVLTQMGLKDKEASIYLAALELGDAPASEIAQRAKINRVTTYDILEKLIKQGYVSTYSKKNIRMFAATAPEALVDQFKDRFQSLKAALPQLQRLHGNTSHPKVRYYEGLEGIKQVYADTLTAKTELLNYADSKSIRDFWPEYDEEYVAKRVKNRIYLRGIAPLDKYGQRVAKESPYQHREIRLVTAGPFAFANEINIYDDKISIISFGKTEIVGMIIESEEVANTQRAIFMMAWEFAGIKN